MLKFPMLTEALSLNLNCFANKNRNKIVLFDSGTRNFTYLGLPAQECPTNRGIRRSKYVTSKVFIAFCD